MASTSTEIFLCARSPTLAWAGRARDPRLGARPGSSESTVRVRAAVIARGHSLLAKAEGAKLSPELAKGQACLNGQPTNCPSLPGAQLAQTN